MSRNSVLFRVAVCYVLLPLSAPIAVAGPYEDGWHAYNQRDYDTAYDVWRALADAGDSQAQLMVGLLFANGHGVERNVMEAYKWFLISDRNGNPYASSLFEGATRLDELLTPDARAAAEQQARDWRPNAPRE